MLFDVEILAQAASEALTAPYLQATMRATAARADITGPVTSEGAATLLLLSLGYPGVSPLSGAVLLEPDGGAKALSPAEISAHCILADLVHVSLTETIGRIIEAGAAMSWRTEGSPSEASVALATIDQHEVASVSFVLPRLGAATVHYGTTDRVPGIYSVLHLSGSALLALGAIGAELAVAAGIAPFMHAAADSAAASTIRH